LFSTLLAALAAWTRLFTDAFGQLGLLDFHNLDQRRRWIGVSAWIIPTIWGTCYLLMEAPTAMVLIGGAATTAILLIVVFAAVIMRWRWLPQELKPGRIYDTILLVSMLAIASVGVWGLVDTIKKNTAKPAAPTEEVEKG
jgi:hypothetical protein